LILEGYLEDMHLGVGYLYIDPLESPDLCFCFLLGYHDCRKSTCFTSDLQSLDILVVVAGFLSNGPDFWTLPVIELVCSLVWRYPLTVPTYFTIDSHRTTCPPSEQAMSCFNNLPRISTRGFRGKVQQSCDLAGSPKAENTRLQLAERR